MSAIDLLADWLGDGSAVTDVLAGFRAERCRQCQLNVEPKWWERATKEPVAEVIRKQLELKTGMKLHVENEDELGMCKACGCCISLKIWVPITHVKYHTNPQTMKKFVDNCWIRKELSL